TRPRELSGHRGGVWAVAFRPAGGGAMLASAGGDGKVLLWDFQEPNAIRRSQAQVGHASWVMAVALRPGGRWPAPGGEQGEGGLGGLEAAPARPGPPLKGHRQHVLCLAFSPDGKALASGGAEGDVCLWDVADPTRPRKLLAYERHEGPITGVTFGPGGGWVA